MSENYNLSVFYDSDTALVGNGLSFQFVGANENSAFNVPAGSTITIDYTSNATFQTPPSPITVNNLDGDYWTSTTNLSIALNSSQTVTALSSGGAYGRIDSAQWDDRNEFTFLRAVGGTDSSRAFFEPDRFSYIQDPDPYGIRFFNGQNNVIIDRFEPCFAVKQMIDLDPAGPDAGSISYYTTFSGNAKYCIITLTEGDYPGTGGLPIAAINCQTQGLLVPPTVSGLHGDGSYKFIQVIVPSTIDFADYRVAVLVEVETTEPAYMGGGSEADHQYGLDLFNNKGDKIWSSNWRQCVITNVVPIGYDSADMDAGGIALDGPIVNESRNAMRSFRNAGTFDVLPDDPNYYDGVYCPDASVSPTNGGTGQAELTFALQSLSKVKTVNGLNTMDASKTFLLGNTVQGFVEYRPGDLVVDGSTEQTDIGGGLHTPALTISGQDQVQYQMWRYTGGTPDASGTEGNLERNANSRKPTGAFVLARII